MGRVLSICVRPSPESGIMPPGAYSFSPRTMSPVCKNACCHGLPSVCGPQPNQSLKPPCYQPVQNLGNPDLVLLRPRCPAKPCYGPSSLGLLTKSHPANRKEKADAVLNGAAADVADKIFKQPAARFGEARKMLRRGQASPHFWRLGELAFPPASRNVLPANAILRLGPVRRRCTA